MSNTMLIATLAIVGGGVLLLLKGSNADADDNGDNISGLKVSFDIERNGNIIIFKDTSTMNVNSYVADRIWFPGDGTQYNKPETYNTILEHTYYSDGTYNALLQITTNLGIVRTATKKINVSSISESFASINFNITNKNGNGIPNATIGISRNKYTYGQFVGNCVTGYDGKGSIMYVPLTYGICEKTCSSSAMCINSECIPINYLPSNFMDSNEFDVVVAAYGYKSFNERIKINEPGYYNYDIELEVA